MKITYTDIPASMQGMITYGFSWMDFVTAIPAPLFLVTTYKKNGMPNACLQSWACFSGEQEGFTAVLSNVSRHGHLYRTIHETGEAVINFPSADVYDRCLATIRNNAADCDEITASGLTAERDSVVNAPRIAECFLHLSCRFLWEKEIRPGSDHVLMCLDVVGVSADQEHLDERLKGRYGESGLLYNIHYPVNPEGFAGKSHDHIAVLHRLRDMGEY